MVFLFLDKGIFLRVDDEQMWYPLAVNAQRRGFINGWQSW
jgi:hypothetical protein